MNQFCNGSRIYSRYQCRHLVNGTKHVSSLIMVHSLHYAKTRCYPQNRNYITDCIAVRGGPSHGRSYGEIWTCGFWEVWADKQTDTHTSWSQFFAPLPGERGRPSNRTINLRHLHAHTSCWPGTTPSSFQHGVAEVFTLSSAL